MGLGLRFFFFFFCKFPAAVCISPAPYPRPINNPVQAIADRGKAIIRMRPKINFPHVPTQRHSYLFNRENSLAPLSGCQDRLLRKGARLASDQTQRLVKRQKQLKIFMNNAVSPSPV